MNAARQVSAKWVLDLTDDDEEECSVFSTCSQANRPSLNRPNIAQVAQQTNDETRTDAQHG
ncbi:hypothetical protein PI124_g529 [Phytophthora idaei]|nr:hypothetical protein PI125_g4249 [Phytophthora idaei]KAG3167305.1 hypothetical protein PI126_g3844 [Phytophthora idaei]KAG3254899.1 hypothetical protein PI124_g529 [Phytophthora idaei]